MPAVVRVFLVDDSAVVRGAIRRILEKHEDITVVGTAPNGRVAIDTIAAAQPDVVLLDIEMPEMDGLETLPHLLKAVRGLRVIMASSLTRRGAKVTLDALALGATDYITKPTSHAGPDALGPMAEQLVAKVRGLAGRAARVAPDTAAIRESASASPAAFVRPRPVLGHEIVRAMPRSTMPLLAPELIAIASSTGGPNALASLLRALPREVRTPIVVTQHMPPLFTQLLAQRLERECGRTCVEAVDGLKVEPGHVYIAPGDHHLVVEAADHGFRLRLNQDPPEHHCRPSANPMFRSIAQCVGSKAVAVVLTGMGEDGASGTVAIRNRGGRVLVQDEASSVVWGMPGAAVAAGSVDAVLPIPEIAQRLATFEMVSV